MAEEKKSSESPVYFHPEQLRYLEKIFPEIVPDANTSPNELYIRGGTRKVIYFIKSKVRQ